MILPCPDDFKDLKRFPLTITLVALNVFIFILIFSGTSSSVSSSNLLRPDGLLVTGRIYYQYLQTLPAETLFQKPDWVREMKSTNSEQMAILGAYGLRDAKFLEVAEGSDYRGDDVQIAQWKTSLVEFRKKYKEQLLYRFGLSSLEMKPFSWITYQFSHSNWMHLLSNIVFLALMGAAVEVLAGSGALLLLYLLGGIAGGAGFLYLDPQGTVPMVGASASISALLAFYCFAEARMRVRFLYFLSPLPGHYGAIFLPTLLIVPLFLLSDLASLWSSPEGLGSGVAYAAHLGGAVIGAIVGMLYRLKSPAFFKATL